MDFGDSQNSDTGLYSSPVIAGGSPCLGLLSHGGPSNLIEPGEADAGSALLAVRRVQSHQQFGCIRILQLRCPSPWVLIAIDRDPQDLTMVDGTLFSFGVPSAERRRL